MVLTRKTAGRGDIPPTVPSQKSSNLQVFRLFAHIRYARLRIFANLTSSCVHAATVACRDRFRIQYDCHRRTLCLQNLKSHCLLSLWAFLPAHNKKSQLLFWTYNQSRLLPSTKLIAGRRFAAARASLPIPPQHSDLQVAL